MKVKLGLIGFAMLLYMLLALLFVSTLHAQNNDDFNARFAAFGSQIDSPRDFAASDLLRIVMAGGISRIDTSILGGRVINDTTLHYFRNGDDMLVNFNIQYVDNGVLTDDWSPGIDSAYMRFVADGVTNTVTTREQIHMYSDPFLITGLRMTSNELTIYPPRIKPPSTMRILGLKLKLWLLMDLFGIEGRRGWVNLKIRKSDCDITQGNILFTVQQLDANGNVTGEKEFDVEFIGNHQAVVNFEGTQDTVTYNNISFLIP